MMKLRPLHTGVVNIVDYIPQGTVKKADGRQYDVFCVIVEEIADGGELFYYVKNSGYFSEKIARYYFHQMIEALEFVHTAGLAHRDIKPDNILLDDKFNIKIADFGFAGPLAGRTGTGYLTTKLGTLPYQAPEINERKPYKGTEVDLFALAIVLFITISGTPPFTQADKSEFYYKLIVNQKWDTFWKYHIKGKPSPNFFSEEFKSLIKSMFDYEPTNRLTIAQIKEHPWYKGPLPTYDEVKEEFTRRKEINDDEQRAEEAQKRQRAAQTRRAYGDTHRGLTDVDGDTRDFGGQLKIERFVLEKPIEQYVKIEGKRTHFMIAENPDTIMDVLFDYQRTKQQEEEEVKLVVDPSSYKATLSYESSEVELVVKIFRVGEADVFDVDCTRKLGDFIQF